MDNRSDFFSQAVQMTLGLFFVFGDSRRWRRYKRIKIVGVRDIKDIETSREQFFHNGIFPHFKIITKSSSYSSGQCRVK